MSTTTECTLYSLQGVVGTAESVDGIYVTLYASSGATDESALALFEAISGVPWPAGVACRLTLSKTDDTQVTRFADLTASPPTFI